MYVYNRGANHVYWGYFTVMSISVSTEDADTSGSVLNNVKDVVFYFDVKVFVKSLRTF